MIINVYAVYDSKAAVYNTPFFMKNDAMAIRAFASLVNDPQSTLYSNPADFDLRRVGKFWDESGIIDSEWEDGNVKNEILVTASSVKKAVETVPVDVEVERICKKLIDERFAATKLVAPKYPTRDDVKRDVPKSFFSRWFAPDEVAN